MAASEVTAAEDTMKKYMLEQISNLEKRVLSLERAVDVLEGEE